MSFENTFNENFLLNSPPFILRVDSDIDIDEVELTSFENILDDEILITDTTNLQNSQNSQNSHNSQNPQNLQNLQNVQNIQDSRKTSTL